ncbi:hypothetical protein [Streptomyces sp. LN590]|uniref:hypothetical protein n=1 Tax=Streptomyces sp. LN590 TaxID=3112980 RepID=UPI0037206EE6
MDPKIGPERPTREGHVPLREYTEGTARVIYHVTVLGAGVISGSDVSLQFRAPWQREGRKACR